jgi:DNA-binding MarR family transcriptional regulator
MFDLENCLAFITNKTTKNLNEVFNDKLVAKGSTRVQWTALFYLGKYEGISQIELCQLMEIKPSTMARLIDRLEANGFVEREKNSKDRRTIKLELTEEGKKMREKILPEGIAFSETITKNITEEELKVFLKVLQTMGQNVSENS